MRRFLATATLALGMLARVAAAQVPQPQRLPPALTIDTLNAVTVQNQRKVPVTVFLEYGQFDRRLGVVAPYETKSLSLPGVAVRGRARVQLLVHPEGEAADLVTQQFSLRAPARIALVVPPQGWMAVADEPMAEVIPPEALAEATLTVDNPSARRVTVYARQGRFDVRLGDVPAKGRATLRFPKSVVLPSESIVLFVHPEGALDLTSQTLRIKRGDHLGLKVPAS
ncbi:MAG: hypothetical protein ACXWZS_12670 [Gemmatirosa sp.]